jgi:hypothetical protein
MGDLRMIEDMKKNPLALMLALSVDTSMKFTAEINNLIKKYQANGVDVIPIKEIEELQATTLKESMENDNSLVNSILKDSETTEEVKGN